MTTTPVRNLVRLGLIIALLAPATARATHTDCTHASNVSWGDETPACPEFSPEFSATVDDPWVDAPTNITYRWVQNDDESAAISTTLLVPRGWNFATASVRPGEDVSGVRADDPGFGASVECADLYDPGTPRKLVRGEGLSPNIGMQMYVTTGSTRTLVNFGNSSGPGTRKPNISFLRWNGSTGTADVCLYLYSGDSAVANAREFILPATLAQISGNPTYGWSISIDLDQIARNPVLFVANASVVYFYLSLPGVTGGNWNTDPADPSRKSPVAFSRAPSTPESTALGITWDTCRDGLRAPGALAPGQTPCRNDATIRFSASRTIEIMLPPTTTYAVDFGRLTGPGKIPGIDPPYGPSTTPNIAEGFGLVTGHDTANVTWTQPGEERAGVRVFGPQQTVRGYVIVVAKPGDQEGRYFEYLDTMRYLVDSYNEVVEDGDGDPVANPRFDPRRPCGTRGTDDACSFPLKFPKTGTGGAILDGNAKYDVALVTVYADGHRTDGLCDDGTGPGARCAPGQPGLKVRGTGISSWQFIMRTTPFENRYLQTFVVIYDSATGRPSGCTVDSNEGVEAGGARLGTGNGLYVCAGAGAPLYWTLPDYLLLVDYPRKMAEFIVWGDVRQGPLISAAPFVQGWTTIGNPQNGSGQSYPGSSATIQGNGNTGVVSFGWAKPDGSASSFRFDGVTTPVLARQGATAVAPTPCLNFLLRISAKGGAFNGVDGGVKAACGVFTLFTPNNWTLGQLGQVPDPGHPSMCIGITETRCQPRTLENVFTGLPI